MSGHTKGPWTVYTPSKAGATYGISGDDGTAVVFWGDDINDGINKIEDARLIAAAPELLAELRIVYERSYNPFEPDNQSEQYKRVGALIAKATGSLA